MQTKDIPDPDILIEQVIQKIKQFFIITFYSEIFLKKLWPDFNSNDFKKIINEYKNIKRNLNMINQDQKRIFSSIVLLQQYFLYFKICFIFFFSCIFFSLPMSG